MGASNSRPPWPASAPTYQQPHYSNGVFGNVYLLALDDTNIAGASLP